MHKKLAEQVRETNQRTKLQISKADADLKRTRAGISHEPPTIDFSRLAGQKQD
jgi:hypothetical protein